MKRFKLLGSSSLSISCTRAACDPGSGGISRNAEPDGEVILGGAKPDCEGILGRPVILEGIVIPTSDGILTDGDARPGMEGKVHDDMLITEAASPWS